MLGSVPLGGRTQAVATLTLATVATLFAVDAVVTRLSTGRWEQNVLRLAARDRTIVPIQLLTFAVFAVALSAPRFAPGLDVPGSAWVPALIGVTIAATGIAFRAWAIATLRKAFSRVVRVEPGQRLVTTGPYRFLRHPSYTGALLAFTGIGLMVGNWLALAAMAVIPTIGYVIRIFVEERTMASAMGDRYAEFACNRSRLIPGVW